MRRDVDRLRELGYPVRATKGPDGGYRLDAGAELPPLLFDDEQAVAVAVALQTATTSVAGIEEGALRALATVRQVMPARLRQRVDALQVTAVPRDGEQPRVDTEQLIAIGAAVRAREVLRFDYDAPNWTGEERPWQPPRRVEPHHLMTWGGRWYLIVLGPRPGRLAHLPGGPDDAEDHPPGPDSRRGIARRRRRELHAELVPWRRVAVPAASSSCTRRPPRCRLGRPAGRSSKPSEPTVPGARRVLVVGPVAPPGCRGGRCRSTSSARTSCERPPPDSADGSWPPPDREPMTGRGPADESICGKPAPHVQEGWV